MRDIDSPWSAAPERKLIRRFATRRDATHGFGIWRGRFWTAALF
jgi:hypothetical protein